MTKIYIKQSPNLTNAETGALFMFLQRQLEKQHRFFNRDVAVDDVTFERSALVHDLDPNTQSFQIDFIGDQLGAGTFGVIYEITQSVRLSQSACTLQCAQGDAYSHGKVGKVLTKLGREHQYDQKQFNVSHLFPHLGIEKPLVDKVYGGIVVMNRVPGRELFDIFIEDTEEQRLLTIDERIKLTKGLLLTAKTQLKGVVHRDIKPENIMVDLDTMTINIVDVDMALEIPAGQDGAWAKDSCGSLSYAAPESFKRATRGYWEVRPSRDVFALARILEVLWGGYDASFGQLSGKAYLEKIAENYKNGLPNLFALIPKEQKDNRLFYLISCLLLAMLHPDPIQRMTLDDAIEEICGIESEYQEALRGLNAESADSALLHSASLFAVPDTDRQDNDDEDDSVILCSSSKLAKLGRSQSVPLRSSDMEQRENQQESPTAYAFNFSSLRPQSRDVHHGAMLEFEGTSPVKTQSLGSMA